MFDTAGPADGYLYTFGFDWASKQNRWPGAPFFFPVATPLLGQKSAFTQLVLQNFGETHRILKIFKWANSGFWKNGPILYYMTVLYHFLQPIFPRWGRRSWWSSRGPPSSWCGRGCSRWWRTCRPTRRSCPLWWGTCVLLPSSCQPGKIQIKWFVKYGDTGYGIREIYGY